jgi:hypothetical protein
VPVPDEAELDAVVLPDDGRGVVGVAGTLMLGEFVTAGADTLPRESVGMTEPEATGTEERGSTLLAREGSTPPGMEAAGSVGLAGGLWIDASTRVR